MILDMSLNMEPLGEPISLDLLLFFALGTLDAIEESLTLIPATLPLFALVEIYCFNAFDGFLVVIDSFEAVSITPLLAVVLPVLAPFLSATRFPFIIL